MDEVRFKGQLVGVVGGEIILAVYFSGDIEGEVDINSCVEEDFSTVSPDFRTVSLLFC